MRMHIVIYYYHYHYIITIIIIFHIWVFVKDGLTHYEGDSAADLWYSRPPGEI